MTGKRTRKEMNVEATRAALLAVARRHFARDGYSKAEIGRIAADARVTTGAIYHHFSSKQGLFLAVAEDLEQEILDATLAISVSDPWQRLRTVFDRLIDVCASPAVQRITFVEAPQVLEPDAWQKIELKYAFGQLKAGLEAMQAAGLVKPYPTALIAKTLLSLLREASAEVARSKSEPAARALVGEMVDRLVEVFHEASPSKPQ